MKIKEEIAAQKDLFYEDLNKIIAIRSVMAFKLRLSMTQLAMRNGEQRKNIWGLLVI